MRPVLGLGVGLLVGVGGCRGPKGDGSVAFDGFSWEHEWSASSDSASELVGDVGSPAEDGAEVCWETNLGTAVGASVATGDQRDGDNLYDCNGGTGRELVFRWTPPDSGRWTLTTIGSEGDTVLEVRAGCEGRTLLCNDDYSGLASGGSIEVEEGEEVIVIVDSYSSSSEGNVVLNIE